MSEPPFWLGAGRRVRDRIESRPVRCGHRRFRSLAFRPPGLDLAGKRLALMHAHIRISQERRQVVVVAVHGLTGESPVEREADLVDQAPLDGIGPLVPISEAGGTFGSLFD
jgi:hypothetical protein